MKMVCRNIDALVGHLLDCQSQSLLARICVTPPTFHLCKTSYRSVEGFDLGLPEIHVSLPERICVVLNSVLDPTVRICDLHSALL